MTGRENNYGGNKMNSLDFLNQVFEGRRDWVVEERFSPSEYQEHFRGLYCTKPPVEHDNDYDGSSDKTNPRPNGAV